ncbi:MAG: hypothetical protein HPY60_05975 [Candidatus Methanofastidiosum sp.]|nr:hypothetical protein [Methanofastidiosum sp.]
MTSDFKPGKAYLIEGKSIEQVKGEIKEWFQKHDFEVLEEGKKEIQGRKIPFGEGYDIWLYIKLKSIKGGTLMVFNNTYVTKYYDWNLIWFPYLKNYVLEWSKNLVRFLLSREETELNYTNKFFYFGYFLSAVSIILSFILGVSGIISSSAMLLLIIIVCLCLGIGLNVSRILYGNKLSNLPEYKVEEYKGEIEID